MSVFVLELVDLDAREFADQCLGEFQLPVGDRCGRGEVSRVA
ncbi:hypothetical protein [Streptomyces sp. AcE210]|nr:hypothetical protein [Streptomyces sp. AcE210]